MCHQLDLKYDVHVERWDRELRMKLNDRVTNPIQLDVISCIGRYESVIQRSATGEPEVVCWAGDGSRTPSEDVRVSETSGGGRELLSTSQTNVACLHTVYFYRGGGIWMLMW